MYAIITPILALATTIASHPLVSGDPVPESPTSETITITDLNIILPETSVDNIETINFVLNGDQATGLVCKQDAPSLPSTPIVCGNSGYSFILEKGEEGTYALKVSHGIRDGYTLVGPTTDIFTVCRAAGNRRTICQSQSVTEIELTHSD